MKKNWLGSYCFAAKDYQIIRFFFPIGYGVALQFGKNPVPEITAF